MNSSKAGSIISWILVVLLSLGYLAAAAGKLTGAANDMFVHWGYPAWFAIVIGVFELIGVVGLLIPKTTRYAVVWLSLVMIGAGYTHIANQEGLQVLRPIIFVALLWTVWLLRRPSKAIGPNVAAV